MYTTLKAQTTGSFEKKKLLGQEYLVVPVIAMIEGVRLGAAQASGELGLSTEFGKFPSGWDNKPVVLNHPKIEGSFVSASDPKVLESYGLGLIYNTALSDKKLRMEAWLNLSLKDQTDGTKEIFARVEAGEIVEVSVGFFTEVEEVDGTFKGQEYTGIWRNIVPDHLAFLEAGTIGACSVEDGCGTRVNSKNLTTSKGTMDKGKKKPKAKANESTCGDTCTCGGTCGCNKPAVLGKVLLSQDPETLKNLTVNVNGLEITTLQHLLAMTVPNEMLSNDIIGALSSALNDVYDYAYVIGYTTDYAVFSAYTNGEWSLLRRAFNVDSNGTVTFTADDEAIRLITKIVPVSQNSDSVITNSTMENEMPKSTTKVQTAETVEGCEKAVETVVETPVEAVVEEVTETSTEEPTAQTKKVTTQEYIAQAPADIREVLEASVKVHQAQKDDAIKALKATGRCSFSDDHLKAQTLDTLKSYLGLAAVPDYTGRVVPTTTVQEQDKAPTPPKAFERTNAVA